MSDSERLSREDCFFAACENNDHRMISAADFIEEAIRLLRLARDLPQTPAVIHSVAGLRHALDFEVDGAPDEKERERRIAAFTPEEVEAEWVNLEEVYN